MIEIARVGLLTAAVFQASGARAAEFHDGVLVKRAQMHMGTLVTITAVAPTREGADGAIDAGFAEIRRLEQLLSTWIAESELSRVNAKAGHGPVRVSPETLSLLQRSIEIAGMTEGAFNIAIGPAIEAWGFGKEERIPSDAELVALKPLTDLSQLALNANTRMVFLGRPGMRIDVGGVGKGFAADRAVAVMQRAGATGGVVALSGDIKTFGRMPDGKPFLLGIQHPRQEGALLARVELQDEAISTAGDYERFFERDGVRYHHILDPRTLQPARGCRSVTVIAREGVMADGLDTGIFVMGPERGMDLIERLPDVEGVIVDSQGRILVSSGLKARLQLIQSPP
ncbi:MAG: FAD:protein FMN transferase [Nitrospiraceae bacterium]